MGHRKERPARQGARPQLMRGEPRRGDRANVPVVASRQPLPRGDPGGGRRGALMDWREICQLNRDNFQVFLVRWMPVYPKPGALAIGFR